MKRNYTFMPLLLLLIVAAIACSNNSNRSKKNAEDSEDSNTKSLVNVPHFNADSAYQYIKTQVDFGPRVPNTDAHKACGDYLAGKLEEFGAKIYNQNINLSAYNGTLLKARNIIGAFNPEAKKRIALFAHWDSRPWADEDPDPKKHYSPILGANDGASGVGVLLEIARQMQMQQPELGIDIIFVDAEDYGTHSAYEGEHKVESWGLGSQAWARSPHVAGYNARFGILLDMVGGKNPEFRYEKLSEEVASGVNRKVWKAAKQLGYDRFFVPKDGGEVTDDHTFINRYAKIPTIDIVPYGFFKHWHTEKDDMDAISKETLQAVGQTVMHVIYNEK